MFLVRLLRYFKSYVHFSMEGGFIERFLNLCARAGISVWNLRPTEKGMEGDTLAAHYRQMRPLAKKSGVRLRVQEKRGIYFLRRRYRKRWGLGLGIAFFVLFLSFMSGFIWQVEVCGNATVPTQEIVSQLAAIGVRPGVRRASIDAPMAQRQMLVEMDALSWIAINLRGSTASVEVRERVLPPERVERENDPANIVAAESGLIRKMEVYTGQGVVKPGDTVLEGELLVSGVTENPKGSGEVKRARAMVLAQVQQTLSVSVPLREEKLFPTGRTLVRRGIVVFGGELTFGPRPKGEWTAQRQEAPLTLLGRPLPVTLVITRWEEQERAELVRSEQEAQELAEAQLALLEEEQLADSEILSKTAAARVEDHTFLLQAEYQLLRDIAKTKEFFTN